MCSMYPWSLSEQHNLIRPHFLSAVKAAQTSLTGGWHCQGILMIFI